MGSRMGSWRHEMLVATVAALTWSAAMAGEQGARMGGNKLCIRGVYPHLTVYNTIMDEKGNTRGGNGESGIGAVVPWAGRLWLLTYSPHCPTGSTDKLYAIDPNLGMEIRPESIGGTPAGRMIHKESQQLFIGPYAIDKAGKVRAIPYSVMPGRHTGIARHLTDPANLVYYFDMEGKVYEVNVHTLAVKLLFTKPAPGIHGKGAYTGQGRYIIANNGEGGSGGPDEEEMGVLAEWDGKEWRVVERKQFCDVTGPGGIDGAPDDAAPVWAIGWDRRSVILKLLDAGQWHTFRLPKASHTYDHRGGWYTEWPRIRRIAPDKLLMDMHAMFWDFPAGFRAGGTGGLRPISTHHRYIPDFCEWNGRVVIATDETTLMGNPLVGQAQSNLWFGKVEDLSGWGPCIGWGGPWVMDAVKAGEPSVPFAIGGFAQRCLHLAVGGRAERGGPAEPRSRTGDSRCSDQLPLEELPAELAGLARVTIARGDYHKPAPPYAFTVNQNVVVYLAVDSRPAIQLGEDWEKTDLRTRWRDITDTVYRKAFRAGRVEVPGHPQAHKAGDYGVPHLCFVQRAAAGADAAKLQITGLTEGLGAKVFYPKGGAVATEAAQPATTPATPAAPPAAPAGGDVTFTLEIDRNGDSRWAEYTKLTVPDGGYLPHVFPKDFRASWVRAKTSRDCVATAYFHYSQAGHDPKEGSKLFAALAGVGDEDACGGIIRPAGHNRSLQFLARLPAEGGKVAETYYELDEKLAFHKPEDPRTEEVTRIAELKKDFEVDDASAIMTEGGRRFRLPKGAPRYDKPFAAGWPRGIRESESERYLMNIHGTFYEKPREGGMWKIKAIATHGRQIVDFCTWKGLLVMAGTKRSARPDGQFFRAAEGGTGLWFGAIDDLWSLGKPVGKGGPWLRTAVEAAEPSDPYLMTGFDRKRIELSHDASGEVAVTIEVNPDHVAWRVYKTLAVPAGETIAHDFPEGFSSHWLRLRADRPCKATAILMYE